jgi:hypothetical protein
VNDGAGLEPRRRADSEPRLDQRVGAVPRPRLDDRGRAEGTAASVGGREVGRADGAAEQPDQLQVQGGHDKAGVVFEVAAHARS